MPVKTGANFKSMWNTNYWSQSHEILEEKSALQDLSRTDFRIKLSFVLFELYWFAALSRIHCRHCYVNSQDLKFLIRWKRTYYPYVEIEGHAFLINQWNGKLCKRIANMRITDGFSQKRINTRTKNMIVYSVQVIIV